MTGRWLALVVIVLLGWGALELMLRQMQLGEHARSPQHFELPAGMTVIAGGGLGTLSFVDAPYLRSARMRLKCKEVDRGLQLKPDEISEEICGLRVHLLKIASGMAVVRVSWGDGAAAPGLPPAGSASAEDESADVAGERASGSAPSSHLPSLEPGTDVSSSPKPEASLEDTSEDASEDERASPLDGRKPQEIENSLQDSGPDDD